MALAEITKTSVSSKLKHFFVSNANSLLTIGGVLSGLLLGMLVKSIFWPDKEDQIDPYLLRYISLPGVLYIRVIMLLIAPLLVSSLATSLLQAEDEGEEGDQNNVLKSETEIDAKKLLITTLVFFISFTLVAGLMGISLVVTFQPGVSSSSVEQLNIKQISSTMTTNQSSLIEQRKRAIEQKNYKTDALNNLILNIFPDNILTLLFMTSYVKTETSWPTDNMTSILEPNFKPKLSTQTVQGFKPNMIGICSISFLLGLLLKSMGPKRSAVMRAFLREIDALVGESFNYLLTLMPLGMFCWMFAEGLKMQSIGAVVSQLLLFYTLVVFAFGLLWLVFYPAVVYLFTRTNAFATYRNVFPAILIAIGTTSSAISLPMTMKCMEGPGERLSKPIAQSVLPLGVTIHMNGSALYYPMVALFVAQFKGLEMDVFMLIVLWFFTLAMTMGLPGSPNGGSTIITHIAFASAIGIDDPLDVLAFVMPFECIWERVRTATNITGDCIVAKCIERLNRKTRKQEQINSSRKRQEDLGL